MDNKHPDKSNEQETIYYMTAKDGSTVRVPESKLESWQKAQSEIDYNAPLTPEEQQLVQRMLDRIYGSDGEKPAEPEPPAEKEPPRVIIPDSISYKEEPQENEKSGPSRFFIIALICLAIFAAFLFEIPQYIFSSCQAATDDDRYAAVVNTSNNKESSKEEKTSLETINIAKGEKETKVDLNQEEIYVLNQSSKKFHHLTCSSAKRISEENATNYRSSAQELVNKGYSPCSFCFDDEDIKTLKANKTEPETAKETETNIQYNPPYAVEVHITETETEAQTAAETEAKTEPETKKITAQEADFVLNTSSKKFHYPDCSSADRISKENRSYYIGTAQELENMGYSRCSFCFDVEKETEAKTELETKKPASEEADYVLNTKSKKFHEPSCGSADKIKNENKDYYTGDRSDLISKGYSPCGNCDP